MIGPQLLELAVRCSEFIGQQGRQHAKFGDHRPLETKQGLPRRRGQWPTRVRIGRDNLLGFDDVAAVAREFARRDLFARAVGGDLDEAVVGHQLARKKTAPLTWMSRPDGVTGKSNIVSGMMLESVPLVVSLS